MSRYLLQDIRGKSSFSQHPCLISFSSLSPLWSSLELLHLPHIPTSSSSPHQLSMYTTVNPNANAKNETSEEYEMKEENVHCDNKIYYFHKKIFKIYYLVKNMYFMRFISFAYKVSGTLDTSSAFASFSFCCHSNVLMPINMFHPSWASFKEAGNKWVEDLGLGIERALNPYHMRADPGSVWAQRVARWADQQSLEWLNDFQWRWINENALRAI